MRALTPLGLYAALVFGLAGLLSYPLYILLQGVGVPDVRFHEMVHELLRFSALLGLWPLMWSLGLTSRRDWGYGVSRGRFLKDLLIGTGIGILSLLVLVLCLFLLEVRVFKPDFSFTVAVLAGVFLKAVIAAFVIGVMEETWFRGALHRVVEVRADAVGAVLTTAVLYGAVHFIRPDVPVSPDAIGLWSGFVTIGHFFHRFENAAFVDSFMALVAAGALLGLVRSRTNAIAQCIGIHAGWVIVIKLTRATSTPNPDTGWGGLVGSYDGIIGYLACVWFLLLGISYYWLTPRTPLPSPRR